MKTTFLLSLIVSLLALLSPATASAGEAPCPDLEECPCVMEMAEQLVNKGWVGIRMDDSSGSWTLVEIFPESPAHRAGLRVGDVLVEMDGVPYVAENRQDLRRIYMSRHPGDDLTYVVERDGERHTVRLELARMPKKLLALWLGEKILYSYSAVTGEDLGLFPEKPPGEKPGKKPPRKPDADSDRGEG